MWVACMCILIDGLVEFIPNLPKGAQDIASIEWPPHRMDFRVFLSCLIKLFQSAFPMGF